jgi:acyl transferase domain-containing protein
MPQASPIAIIGMGCRFPKASGPEAFWQLLASGADAITTVPPDRWNADELYSSTRRTAGKMCTRWGGFLEDVDAFDPGFFKIMPAEAARMDPQHRLVLEVAWEALESASLDPARLADSATGVFIGISHSDHDRMLYRDRTRIDGNNGPNTYHCFAANRLSYFLKLRGPSMAVDTACSSSLAAIHLACQSLNAGESDLALAGGVNLNLSPDEFIALSFLGVLSADNQSKTFDASAEGYVRSEGCGIVALKRMEDALQSGDPILAVIRGSALNHNGLSNGITAPSGLAQEEVLGRALRVAGIEPAEVSLVEVMGTATTMGDQIEVAALKNIYSKNRLPEQTCWLGSVKPNIGHLEAASGIASLLKAVLSLQHRTIPPHLHCREPNPRLRLEGTPFVIPEAKQVWTSSTGPRVAAVSSFGFGGANANLILEEAPPVQPSAPEDPPHLLTLSAKTEPALRDLALRYVDFLRRHASIDPGELCYTANTGRAHFDCRLAAVTGSVEELLDQLEGFRSAVIAPRLQTGMASRRNAALSVAIAKDRIEEAARASVSGHVIDWSAYYAEGRRRRLQLPNYPFQRRHCRFV